MQEKVIITQEFVARIVEVWLYYYFGMSKDKKTNIDQKHVDIQIMNLLKKQLPKLY